MIEVMGSAGTSEYEAARAIAASLEATWPGISNTPTEQDHVKIIAGLKLSGYRVSDLDIVVAARFSGKRYIAPKSIFLDTDGNRVAGGKIRVTSFVAVIEVKDHPEAGLNIQAGGVSVRYKNGWSSATDQNDKQLYAISSYLKDRGLNCWVYRSVFLRGIQDLPTARGKKVPEAGAFAAGFSGTDLFMAMAMVNGVRRLSGEFTIQSASPSVLGQVLELPLLEPITPSALDRRRMDTIAKRTQLAREIAAKLGNERVHLRGEGGTGKTVLLLQAAAEAYEREAKRCVILTFNHALAADIQRLLALLGIPSSTENGGVEIKTIMSFNYAWLAKLGLIGEIGEDDFDDYENRCQQALEYIATDAVTEEDVDNIKREDPERFDYDAILIDEAQDWPQQEADLVCALYGGNKISIADGISQLIRGKPTDWRKSIGGQRANAFFHFEECLRMKANLSRFANGLADRAGLNWKVEPSSETAGGRIVLLEGHYSNETELRNSLMESSATAGNLNIDILHCVPAPEVTALTNHKASVLGQALQNEGFQVWDAVDAAVRKDYPRSTDELRIVQYESCRGLEGWVAVLDGFDIFWEIKHQEALRDGSFTAHAQDVESYAKSVAWRWAMIALTRSIDTAVITVRDKRHPASILLFETAKSMPDVVEIY